MLNPDSMQKDMGSGLRRNVKIAALSGWGQPHDALSVIAPKATHIDYARHKTIDAALADITAQAKDHDVVIGWSLGGQLAARAIAAGMFRPEKLVLIATPYQFVATPENPLGMKRDLYDKFRSNVAHHPQRALSKAWELIHKGDSRAEEVRRYLTRARNSPLPLREGVRGRGSLEEESFFKDTPSPRPSPSLVRHSSAGILTESSLARSDGGRGEGEVVDWLQWLDMLDGFSFAGMDLSGFPPTLLIHGGQDAVVGHEQSQFFSTAIPYAKLIIINDAGHAPHWHDAGMVQKMIREYV